MRLTLDVPAEARVTLLDALGREVARVHDGPLSGGEHTFSRAEARLAPGVYTLRAALGARVETRRLSAVR